ncbi:hypothetical protein KUF83_30220 [Streptomyces sp. BV286]|nr:hypothetical protein [Streptomyces sp. BV286]MBV1940813.1 hypothetical protein [Streptomyces sp. BV286]
MPSSTPDDSTRPATIGELRRLSFRVGIIAVMLAVSTAGLTILILIGS